MTTAINLQSIITRNETLVRNEIDGELVMMSADAGEYYALNSVGTHIWNCLVSERSVGELCNLLCQEYAVSPEECQRETLPFLEDLLAHEILLLKGNA